MQIFKKVYLSTPQIREYSDSKLRPNVKQSQEKCDTDDDAISRSVNASCSKNKHTPDAIHEDTHYYKITYTPVHIVRILHGNQWDHQYEPGHNSNPQKNLVFHNDICIMCFHISSSVSINKWLLIHDYFGCESFLYSSMSPG